MCMRAQHVDGAERSGGGQLTRWVLRAGPARGCCCGATILLLLTGRYAGKPLVGSTCASTSTRPNRLHRSVHANVMHARDPRQHVPRPGALEPWHAPALGRAKWSRDQAGDRQNRDEECGERVAPWTTHRTTSTPRCRRTPCEGEGDTPATLASSLGSVLPLSSQLRGPRGPAFLSCLGSVHAEIRCDAKSNKTLKGAFLVVPPDVSKRLSVPESGYRLWTASRIADAGGPLGARGFLRSAKCPIPGLPGCG